MYPERCIVRDMRVLTEQFIPSRVLHREGQLHAIRDDVKPMTEGRISRHVFIHGKPGTGKTCISRYVSEELSSYSSGILNSYTNCWENPSRFRILYNILKDVGASPIVHRKGTPTDEILEMITRSLAEKPCVVILDEVDKIEDDRVLYDILSIPNVCMFMIANTPTALHDIDPRIRSRLASSDNIEFPHYRHAEITDILKDRREWGLIPGVISNNQLEFIAASARGDCRVAIEILRVAAEDAEREGAEKIPDGVIKASIPKAEMFHKEKSSGNLNPHQRTILEIVQESGEIDSGELFRKLNEISREKGLEKIVDRTFRNYVNRLVRFSLLKEKGSGRWRTFSLPTKG